MVGAGDLYFLKILIDIFIVAPLAFEHERHPLHRLAIDPNLGCSADPAIARLQVERR
jgi:hypothetical protein